MSWLAQTNEYLKDNYDMTPDTLAAELGIKTHPPYYRENILGMFAVAKESPTHPDTPNIVFHPEQLNTFPEHHLTIESLEEMVILLLTHGVITRPDGPFIFHASISSTGFYVGVEPLNDLPAITKQINYDLIPDGDWTIPKLRNFASETTVLANECLCYMYQSWHHLYPPTSHDEESNNSPSPQRQSEQRSG